jgi:zinc transporter 9
LRKASFGLVTFLLAEKLERKTIRKYLFVFSVAAPLAALATYFGLSQKSKETLSTVNATGFAMLFS